jgi:hypothetical protein
MNKEMLNEKVEGLKMNLLWIGMSDGGILMQADILKKSNNRHVIWFNAYLNDDYSLNHIFYIDMGDRTIYSHKKTGAIVEPVKGIENIKYLIEEFIKKDRIRLLTGAVRYE